MDIRCVVTGQDKSGKSLIRRDKGVQPVTVALIPGYESHRLWGSDSWPELPSDGAGPLQPRYFPAKNGFRFGFFTLPPATKTRTEQIVTASALEEMQEKLPGMTDVLEPDHPGVHTTDSVDFDVVISGEV